MFVNSDLIDKVAKFKQSYRCESIKIGHDSKAFELKILKGKIIQIPIMANSKCIVHDNLNHIHFKAYFGINVNESLIENQLELIGLIPYDEYDDIKLMELKCPEVWLNIATACLIRHIDEIGLKTFFRNRILEFKDSDDRSGNKDILFYIIGPIIGFDVRSYDPKNSDVVFSDEVPIIEDDAEIPPYEDYEKLVEYSKIHHEGRIDVTIQLSKRFHRKKAMNESSV